jgi:hypothetical protein
MYVPYKSYQVAISSLGTGNPYYTYARIPLHLAHPFVLTLYQGLVNTCGLPAWKRLRRFHVPQHPALEHAFTIEGTDEAVLRAFLAPPMPRILQDVVRMYGGLGKKCAIAFTEQHFELRIPQRLRTAQEYKQFLGVCMACLDHVHALTDIEEVRFGTPPFDSANTRHIAWNPECSERTLPMLNMQRLVIESETHTFEHVERFLTYAAQTLGQSYLKRSVDVYISGDMAHLHVNLQNTLRNLFRQVHIMVPAEAAHRVDR